MTQRYQLVKYGAFVFHFYRTIGTISIGWNTTERKRGTYILNTFIVIDLVHGAFITCNL